MHQSYSFDRAPESALVLLRNISRKQYKARKNGNEQKHYGGENKEKYIR